MFLVFRLSYNQSIFHKMTTVVSVKYMFEHISLLVNALWLWCCQNKVHFLPVAYKALCSTTLVYIYIHIYIYTLFTRLLTIYEI